ncbi:MAG: hypothetical protein GY792_16300 [Gammaproteobacteria bacterium]|nr:hypothetical protein [Gammaproteobacteria bacterium]
MPSQFCALLLVVAGWHANLAAGELVHVPLTIATPESQNLDGRKLNSAVTKIDNGVYGDIDALLVVRNNYLVLKKYFPRSTTDGNIGAQLYPSPNP